MYKKLRIICAIIAALFLVVILPAATFWGLNGLTICGFGAGLFFFLTLIFKKAQYNWEEKHNIPHDLPAEIINTETTDTETEDGEVQDGNQTEEENTDSAENTEENQGENA